MHFYDFLQNRVMIIFRPKYDEPDDRNPEFDLVLSKKMNYDHVCYFFSVTSELTNFFLRWRRKLRSVYTKIP